MIYTLKGISEIVIKGKLDVKDLGNTNYEMLNSLFMTITNANFDDESIEKQILKMLAVRDGLKKAAKLEKPARCFNIYSGHKSVNAGKDRFCRGAGNRK